jgi:hypothetical protein
MVKRTCIDEEAPSEMEPARQASKATWHKAIQECLAGTPVHLLNMLVHPVKTDGRGSPLQLTALPDDPDLRWQIVLALLHVGRFSHRLKPGDLFTREFIGTRRERVRELEIAAAEFFRRTGGDKEELDSIAAALGIQSDSLARRIRARRAKPRR